MPIQDLLLAPIPKKLSRRPGEFEPVKRRYLLIIGPEGEAQSLMPAAMQILKSDIGWEITASLIVPKDELACIIRLEPDSSSHEQGYSLTIKPTGVEISAATPVGAFHGACTLLQILRQRKDALPCLAIQDWPDFPDRGVMLDISRDKVPTLDTLFHLVDLLAEWKINHLELYTEHTFAYLAHPAVWTEASPMTGEDVLKLGEYCHKRFIDLVPNQNSFGHMGRWFRFDQYKALAEAPSGFSTEPGGPVRAGSSLCPTDPRSIRFVAGIFDELLPHFTSRLFNVGCDETWDLGHGRSEKLCNKVGVGRVYLDFLLKIRELCAEHGRTMAFWGDIVVKHPELIPEIPKDVIALVWGYEKDAGFPTKCPLFKEAGVPFYVCPGTSSWNSLAGRTENAAGNLMNAAKNGLKSGAIGFLNTDWGDNGHFQPLSVSYAGFMMGAMASWNAGFDVRKDLGKRLSLCAFQDPTGKTGDVFADLGNVYQIFPKRTINRAIPFMLLFSPLGDGVCIKGVTPAHLAEVEARLRSIEKAARSDKMTCADAPIVRRELDQVLKMMRCAVAAGRARLGVKSWDRARVLAKDMLLNQEHVWLFRNRPGGLKDSLARLEHLVHTT